MENRRKGKDVRHIELKKEIEQIFWGEGDCSHYGKWNAYFLNDFYTIRQFRPQSAVLPWKY